MTKSDVSTFPAYTLDIRPTQNSFKKIAPAINERDYDRAIESATTTIDKIQNLLLVPTLNHRAYALGKKGRFEEACQDAQRIISLAPTSAMGYCLLGGLYAQQGKQLDAIDTYSIGLQSVSQDDSQYAQLVDGKHSAEQQNEKRVDYIRRVPNEVVGGIITLLPREVKSICLKVSTIWWKKTLECSEDWLVSSDDNMTDEQAIKTIPYIAAYVKKLTINTSNQEVWNQYLSNMQYGRFKKIASLHLERETMRHINRNVIVPLTTALSRMNNTITTLHIDCHIDQYYSAINNIMLTDLLHVCTSLTTLRYRTESSLSSVMGDFTFVAGHLALIDLEIVCRQNMTGDQITPLLLRCQNLKRLVLSHCEGGDFVTKVDQYCRNLEVFSFNNEDIVPDGVVDSNDMRGQQSSGLRLLYASNANISFALIQKHSATLEDLSLKHCYLNPQNQLPTTSSDIRLENLHKLTLWRDDYNIVNRLLIEALTSSTKLKHLRINEHTDIGAFIGTLVALPALECLEVFGSGTTRTYHDPYHRQHYRHPLYQLFEAYAASSRPALRKISLRNCNLDDISLAALAKITSLQEATLDTLYGITGPRIDGFITKLGSNLTVLNLVNLGSGLQDSQLKTVASMDGLQKLRLQQLPSVTDDGVIQMVNTMASKIRCLTIVGCEDVGERAIVHAKRKVRLVEYEP